jgi:hypothetical protein
VISRNQTQATEFGASLTEKALPPNEMPTQEQSRTTLAENEEWMAVNVDKTVQRTKALAEEEEQVLKRLGAAVIMQWNTVPTKLQRELFDCASDIGDLGQNTQLKGLIARFLHNHKDDEHRADYPPYDHPEHLTSDRTWRFGEGAKTIADATRSNLDRQSASKRSSTE